MILDQKKTSLSNFKFFVLFFNEEYLWRLSNQLWSEDQFGIYISTQTSPYGSVSWIEEP